MSSPEASPPRLALRIEVATLRGARQGVPRLVSLLQEKQAGATFYFNVGRDRGSSLRRMFRRGWLSAHGAASLFYGKLLPAPDVGRRCAETMREVRDAGFEVGVLGRDPVRWQARIGAADSDWTEREMQAARRRFEEILGAPPATSAAPGWQTCVHALRRTQRLDYDYCSDSRGSRPYIPVHRAEIVACPQVPTTLPTLDELLGDGGSAESLAQRLLQLTAQPPNHGHVYTARAEYDGGRLAAVFTALLDGWLAQGYRLVSLRDLLGEESARLPKHEIIQGKLPGHPGPLALQGPEFLT